jgi:chromosome segregation ATPase
LYLERERRQMREDPDKEAHDLTERLHKLELERKGFQRLAARGSMTDHELDAALTELDGKRKELHGALREAQGRQDALGRSLRSLADLHFILTQLNPMKLKHASPQDRRRIYEVLRLQVTVYGED